MTEKKGSPVGLWDGCQVMESNARLALHEHLAPYERIVRELYEAGVHAPTIPATKQGAEHLQYAGLFLKKTLTDLRSTWVLLTIGYSSPAATLVASLWESALTCSVVAGNPDSISDIKQAPHGDIPWGAMELAKRHARSFHREALADGVTDRYESFWRELYGQYKWLCKIKHPTVRSASHDAGTTTLADGEYVIMAAPDIRPVDQQVKVFVLSIAVSRTFDAILHFVSAAECTTTHAAYTVYQAKMKVVSDSLDLFTKGRAGPLPFDLSTETLAREYRALRSKPTQTSTRDP